MRKQPSRRRWLARYRLGRWIPWLVVEQHRLPVSQDDEVDQLARYRLGEWIPWEAVVEHRRPTH